MTKFALTVNDRLFETQVEPRTHLGDFLRDQLRLTGTHLGCEHGVCGACTVLINGSPARACITLAVACEGLAVRTIEGFDEDPLMRRIRDAFSREHGLQCGFCTPGMVITARDIVLRLPDADEARVRRELAGNLCRCTGYAGIVTAVCSVLKEATTEERRAAQATNVGASGLALQALTSGSVTAAVPVLSGFTTFTPRPSEPSGQGRAAVPSDGSFAPRAGWSRFEESFEVHQPPSRVWSAFGDIPFVARCLPGAEVSEQDGRTVKGRLAVKLGPIAASFVGSAVVERDDSALAGMIKGAGTDSGSGSRTKGEVAYRLEPAAGGEGTRVRLVVDYSLQGPWRSSRALDLRRSWPAALLRSLRRTLSAAWLGTRRLRQHPRRRSTSAHCYGWHFAVGFARCSVAPDATIIGSNLSSKQKDFSERRRMGDLSEPRRATSAFGTSWTYDDVRELVVIGWKADVQRDDRVGRYFTDSSLVLRVITLNSFKRLIADRSDETRLARSRVFPRQLGHTLCARAPLVVYLLD